MILFLSYEQFHIDITTFFLIIRKRWKIFKKMYQNIIKKFNQNNVSTHHYLL